jgi:hypothetical protein
MLATLVLSLSLALMPHAAQDPPAQGAPAAATTAGPAAAEEGHGLTNMLLGGALGGLAGVLAARLRHRRRLQGSNTTQERAGTGGSAR